MHIPCKDLSTLLLFHSSIEKPSKQHYIYNERIDIRDTGVTRVAPTSGEGATLVLARWGILSLPTGAALAVVERGMVVARTEATVHGTGVELRE